MCFCKESWGFIKWTGNYGLLVNWAKEEKLLAWWGLLNLSCCDACWVTKLQRAPGGKHGQMKHETSHSPLLVVLVSKHSLLRFWGCLVWHLRIGRARHPGPQSGSIGVEVFHVGGWLMHGDFALEAGVDFLGVVEHRLVPARVRSEWSRLRLRGIGSVWASASQDSSHVGYAGVGVVSLKGAPPSLPTIATAGFRTYFALGRAIRCLLPLGSGRFMHLVVLSGYQGSDTSIGQLQLSDQLIDAALSELAVVAGGQPGLIVGDFNVEPTKIPSLATGISAGLWVDLESSWAFASGREPAVTCKRTWASDSGNRRDFQIGCPLCAAAVRSCSVLPDRWIQPHLAFRSWFGAERCTAKVTQPVRFSPLPLWPASWLSVVDKSRTPDLLRSEEFGRSMMRDFN